MAAPNSTATVPATATQPVTGQSLFWAVMTLALGAMSQSSVVADHFRDATNSAEGTLEPYASSPIHCFVDAAFEIVILSRYVLRATGTRKPKPEPREPPDGEPSASPEGDGASAEASPTRQLVAARGVLFVLAIVPQAVKVFGMRGIPGTQVVVALFLATVLTRFLVTLVGERLEDDRRSVYAFRRYIAENRGQFEVRAMGVQVVFAGLVWHRILQGLPLPGPGAVASIRYVLYWSPWILLPFEILQVIWCLAILLNQWRLLRCWQVPVSPFMVILPLISATSFLQYLVDEGANRVDGTNTSHSGMSFYWTIYGMFSTCCVSYVLAVIFALGTGRLAKDNTADDLEDGVQANPITVIPDASQSLRSSEDTPRSSSHCETSPQSVPSVGDAQHASSIHVGDAASGLVSETCADVESEVIGQDPREHVQQEDSVRSDSFPASPADGSRLSAMDALAIAAESLHTKNPSGYTKAINTMHPVDQLSVAAWKTTSIVLFSILAQFLPSADKDRPRNLTSKMHAYRDRSFNMWIFFSMNFRDFRRLIPNAIKAEWKGISEAEKSRSLLRRTKTCGVLLMWSIAWLLIKMAIFLIFAVVNSCESSAVSNYLGVIQARFHDTVWWTTLAIFNLTTAAIYYLIVFDGEGTSNPDWTTWFGR